MEKENCLGYEKIGTLIKRFSIPCMISLLVNSLYNMVDQVFIGWGVGYLGNGATNVVFPLVVTALAIALMIQDGTSAYLSLRLGEKNKKEASRGVANGIIIAVILSIILSIVSICNLPKLLNIFGCTDALKGYALDYGYIIAIGFPFMILSIALNSIIRADGNPKFAMLSILSGAILNIILDPIFIFVFHMGVKGAALATIISQLLTFIINTNHMKKLNNITFTRELFRPNLTVIRKIIFLGTSSFITQMSLVVVFTIQNNLLGKYGIETKFGSEIPITVLGIVLKINQILDSIIIGIAVGAQPILGYNYGAKKYDRVKETLKQLLKLGIITSTIAFTLFQLIPDKLILIFGNGNELYIEFACLSFRIFLMLCIFNGIQIISRIFFQAIGKSLKSAIISLSRQIIFLIPIMLVLSSKFGLMGILYSGPVADGLAFLLASILLVKEVKVLKIKEKTNRVNKEEYENDIEFKGNSNPIVVTISREYGSGGRYIGKLLAEKLGVKLYDKEFIEKVAKETGFDEDFIKENDERRKNLQSLNSQYEVDNDYSNQLFLKESEIIKDIASKESCIIVGRCSDYILKDFDNVINIFVYNDMKSKIETAIKYYGLNEKNAKKEINKINKQRENYYNFYTDRNWKDKTNYDLCINSSLMGIEKISETIYDLVNKFKCNKGN